MSKLEELVTPTQLLDVIKEGAMKQELVKKYKSSEQDLAMMLLPLYRRGDLTKEEFNDFFKGVSLRGAVAEQEAEEVAPAKREDEPPSEILKSLTKLFGKKSQDDKPSAPEETPPPPQSVTEQPVQPDAETPEFFAGPDPNDAAPDHSDAVPASVEPEPQVEKVEEKNHEGETVFSPLDSAGASSLLNSIFAKLNSIEKRLAAIEEKLVS
ncbi:MAG TPA: hypothetical protein VK463_00640 [Desulfomonilaceae bacterium]|nr:hypothetical protein [Desulfomonilaceae bacterium]